MSFKEIASVVFGETAFKFTATGHIQDGGRRLIEMFIPERRILMS